MNKISKIFVIITIVIFSVHSISLSNDITTIIKANEYFKAEYPPEVLEPHLDMFTDASLEFGVPPSIMMALAIKETTYGTKGVAKSLNNWTGMQDSLYPDPEGYDGTFQKYPNAKESIRDTARLLGKPGGPYDITRYLITNNAVLDDEAYKKMTQLIRGPWCYGTCYSADDLYNTIINNDLKKYDDEFKKLSVDDLKAIIDKYYGPNAIPIPGFDDANSGWDGDYTIPDGKYTSTYLDTSYSGDLTKGYIYQKYHEEEMWNQWGTDSDYDIIATIITNIFLQGEKLYGDGKLHLNGFISDGSDETGPGITDGSFTGLPLPEGSFTCTSGFGYRGDIGLPGASKNHKALDLAAPTGTKVYTVGDGQVTYSSYMGSCGFAVKIDHGNGMVTRYCHLSKLNVSFGQKVKAGDIIALSGNTGNSTGPHLDFQVVKNGVAVDPRNVIEGLKGLKCSNGL